MNARAPVVCTFLLYALTLNAEERFTLTVVVTGVTPNQGQVIVNLFDSEETYLQKTMTIEKVSVGQSDSVDLVFSDLAAGEYAASVHYDVDNDDELDTGIFRIPKEPVGFSNNARGKFGPAKWEKSRFQLEEDLNISVQVINATD